jgi:hypothetical protein
MKTNFVVALARSFESIRLFVRHRDPRNVVVAVVLVLWHVRNQVVDLFFLLRATKSKRRRETNESKASSSIRRTMTLRMSPSVTNALSPAMILKLSKIASDVSKQTIEPFNRQQPSRQRRQHDAPESVLRANMSFEKPSKFNDSPEPYVCQM